MRFSADLTCLAHNAQFSSGLDQALLMQQKGQISEIGRRRRAAPRKASDLIYPTHHPLIKMIIVAHRVVDPIRSLNETGKNFIEIINGESIIEPQIRYRAFWAQSIAIPKLHLGIALSTKQDHLTLPATG
jgi:hypothetical protein